MTARFASSMRSRASAIPRAQARLTLPSAELGTKNPSTKSGAPRITIWAQSSVGKSGAVVQHAAPGSRRCSSVITARRVRRQRTEPLSYHLFFRACWCIGGLVGVW